jgi:NitT/TauT family transport system ATP-binding protein
MPGRTAEMKASPSPANAEVAAAPARKPAAAMIEIDRVSQVFRTSSRQDHLALSDISLTIGDGAFVSILGPSGCGKSTLL